MVAFEQLQSASERLSILVPLTLLAILFINAHLDSAKDAAK